MRIAVFTKNRSNPAYAAARLGAERAARASQASVEHFVPQRPDDADEQAALIREACARGFDAFVVSVVHPTRLREALDGVAAAGIPMFGFVNAVGHPTAVSFVGSDDAAIGEEIANRLFRHLDDEASILVLAGPASAVTSIDRIRGFEAAARSRAAIRMMPVRDGGYAREPARREVVAALATGPHFDGVLAANDMMALGAIDALHAARRRLPVVGVNAIPEAVQAIARGDLLATADFSAMAMAAIATECAIRHLRGESVPAHVELPVRIVDARNWREWDLPFEQRPLPSLADVEQERTHR